MHDAKALCGGPRVGAFFLFQLAENKRAWSSFWWRRWYRVLEGSVESERCSPFAYAVRWQDLGTKQLAAPLSTLTCHLFYVPLLLSQVVDALHSWRDGNLLFFLGISFGEWKLSYCTGTHCSVFLATPGAKQLLTCCGHPLIRPILEGQFVVRMRGGVSVAKSAVRVRVD